MNFEQSEKLRQEIAEIINSIVDDKPAFDDIVDTVINHGAVSTYEYAEYVVTYFEVQGTEVKMTFFKIPARNKGISTVKITEDCHISVYVDAKVPYRIVHKSGRLAVV